MPFIIDSHAHVIPTLRSRLLDSIKEPITTLRRKSRVFLKPVSSSVHRVQTFLRLLPKEARDRIDEMNAIIPFPNFIVESTYEDLKEVMHETGISHTVVIAHPPFISNDFVLRLAKRDPSIIPVVNIPPETKRYGQLLRHYVKRGARALKIHAAADGEDLDSIRYQALLSTASELQLPVILHTGCIHTHLFYRKPELSGAKNFSAWFSEYPDIQFILAHMNYHDPSEAIQLAKRHRNLHLETSWQPAETIAEAVRELGAERIMFGTDWPFAGNNQEVGLKRIRIAQKSGWITESQMELILGKNAARVFGIQAAQGIQNAS